MRAASSEFRPGLWYEKTRVPGISNGDCFHDQFSRFYTKLARKRRDGRAESLLIVRHSA